MRADTRILMVDDSKVIRMTLKKILEQLGFRPEQVREAPGGVEALEIFRSFRPKVVFLDVMMPEMDGEATAHTILEESPETRVVLLTGVTRDDERVRRMIAEGVFEHIEKPLRSEQVRRVLDVMQQEDTGFGRIR